MGGAHESSGVKAHADLLHDSIVRMHEQLPWKWSQQLRSRVLCLAEASGGRLKVATGCSGTDIAVLGLRRLCSYWDSLFGVKVEVQHLFSVENVEFKRRFIIKRVRPKRTFQEMAELCNERVRDLVSNQDVEVESPHIWICGIECDSASSVSIHSASNKECVALASGATGSSAEYCLNFVKKHQPPFVCFENVKKWMRELQRQAVPTSMPSWSACSSSDTSQRVWC